jgi:ATP-dependent helicase/nuclease subunit A
VVVQGVADLVVLLEREIWLIDFKTDAVRESELDARVAQYAPQLKVYARALSRIHNRPVSECWLCFLACGRQAKLAT